MRLKMRSLAARSVITTMSRVRPPQPAHVSASNPLTRTVSAPFDLALDVEHKRDAGPLGATFSAPFGTVAAFEFFDEGQ